MARITTMFPVFENICSHMFDTPFPFDSIVQRLLKLFTDFEQLVGGVSAKHVLMWALQFHHAHEAVVGQNRHRNH